MFFAAFDAYLQYTTKSIGQVFFGEGMIGTAFQTGIDHIFYCRMFLQPLGKGQCIVAMPLSPKGKRFNSLQQEEGIEGRLRGTIITQPFNTGTDDECNVCLAVALLEANTAPDFELIAEAVGVSVDRATTSIA